MGGKVGALAVPVWGMATDGGKCWSQHWLLGGYYLHIRGVASRHEREGEMPWAERGEED